MNKSKKPSCPFLTAEKIFLLRSLFIDDKIGQEDIIMKIAFLVEQACDEARAEVIKSMKIDISVFERTAYEKGFSDCRKRAANVAENAPIDNLRSQSHEGLRLSIADGVRTLQPDPHEHPFGNTH